MFIVIDFTTLGWVLVGWLFKLISLYITDDLPFTIKSNNLLNTGFIELKVDPSGNLLFTGADLEKSSAGASASKYLRIKLNETFYKLALLTD
jgi:hypothetical protein